MEMDLAVGWGGGGLAGFENNFLSDSNMDRSGAYCQNGIGLVDTKLKVDFLREGWKTGYVLAWHMQPNIRSV
jgi:hypothetical protein